MCCGPESLTTSSGSTASASKSKKEAAELKSPENLACRMVNAIAPHEVPAPENLTDHFSPYISPVSRLSLLHLENSTVKEDNASNTLNMSLLQSDAKTDSPMSKYEDHIASLLTNEIYEAFIKYKKVIGKAIRPFIRLDPARSCEDFMQEAYIPFCKGYYYCTSDKVEKSKATNLIYNCVRHYFVDQYAKWGVFHQEGVSIHNGNSLWKENEEHHGPCRSIKAGTLTCEGSGWPMSPEETKV